jgi:hypothetical protein
VLSGGAGHEDDPRWRALAAYDLDTTVHTLRRMQADVTLVVGEAATRWFFNSFCDGRVSSRRIRDARRFDRKGQRRFEKILAGRAVWG